jgi:hypothetical protein
MVPRFVLLAPILASSLLHCSRVEPTPNGTVLGVFDAKREWEETARLPQKRWEVATHDGIAIELKVECARLVSKMNPDFVWPRKVEARLLRNAGKPVGANMVGDNPLLIRVSSKVTEPRWKLEVTTSQPRINMPIRLASVDVACETVLPGDNIAKITPLP